jgi:MurNAc alpha-1-phosphate uridylyltransferase
MRRLDHAFVFAAGLGTRLRPYTLTTPKPMLDLYGRPMLAYGLAGLARAGFAHATVNAAWLADAFAGLPALGPSLGLDVALSVQARPLEHGGDLAFATAFWDRLGPDDAFLAANGDTLFDLDGPALRALAAGLSPEAPLTILGERVADGPLHVRGGRLVGIRDVVYAEAEGPEERWDDAGLKLAHASLRRFLPPPGAPMSFHGRDGLAGRVATAGAAILVRPAPVRARAEVGTVAEYEGRGVNAGLRALAERLLPPTT